MTLALRIVEGVPLDEGRKILRSFIDAAEKNGQIRGPLRRDLRLYWQELTLLDRSWPCWQELTLLGRS